MPARRPAAGLRYPLAAAVALTALLAVLGVFQYRWIGAVSDADRDRMRAAAIATANRVADRFDREISRVFEVFGPALLDGAPSPDDWSRWETESTAPGILAGLFVADRAPGGAISVRRADSVTGALVATEWPPELAPLKERIVNLSSEEGARERPVEHRDHGPGFRRGGLAIVEEVSAVVAPREFIPRRRPGDARPADGASDPNERRGGGSTFDTRGSWVVVLFDRAALLAYLSQLVGQNFGGGGDLDAAVLRGDDVGRVLVRSRNGFPPARPFEPDATASLFALQPLHPPRGAAPRAQQQGKNGREGRPPFDPSTARPDEGPFRPPRGAWTLVVRHRSGSLQSAVETIRHRNLAVSGGILLLLAAAVAFLLWSAHRAQRLARQQIEFVAGITHELRTPLAAIRSAGQNLADGLVSDTERIRQYGRLLEKEGRRLSGLIEQALEYAGVRGRREDLSLELVDVPAVVKDAVAACRPLMEEHTASVLRDVPEGLPSVRGNASSLRTLFENLIANAIKYGGRGGAVSIDGRVTDRLLEVTVSDRGPGIDPTDLSRIFEPFYRSPGSSRDVAGSGLGLSLVRRIAAAHGGSVRVESAPGMGATFRVLLPLGVSSSPPGEERREGAVS